MIISPRPTLPSDEAIDAKVAHVKGIERAIMWGGGQWRSTIILCDKYGRNEHSAPTKEGKTMGLSVFMESQSTEQ